MNHQIDVAQPIKALPHYEKINDPAGDLLIDRCYGALFLVMVLTPFAIAYLVSCLK